MPVTEEPDAHPFRELLHRLEGHLDAALALTRQALAQTERPEHAAARQFFQKCLEDFARARGEAYSLGGARGRKPAPAPEPTGEQVSAASFAPGDGADDAQVTPERARGKPGNWPAY